MGGLDLLLSDLLRNGIESFLGRKAIDKIEKRLFEKYGLTLRESMEDFEKFNDVLYEIFGAGSKGMIHSVLSNLCNLKKSKGRKDSLVILHNPNLTEKILGILGDRYYRKILDLLIDKSLTAYEILDRVEIPQASAYRKMEVLIESGLLVEDGRVLGNRGRHAIRFTTLYRGLDMSIVKNRITVQIKMNKHMLQKSTILSTQYSV
ncbi:MAG: winged helix-turn-helix domain-containing protein [Nitrosopumilus sp.]|uniref:winged helix-turn-helix domain-containing protein n=1 Tax=Nitrosopumilus sp. TaxID=2024843 RepID=UPI00242A40B9|nr:helix-turn-helix domain-containing protein [Nitrosopumilus sp.]MCV0366013.1 winged helix-turn-helix domain-containing protein [Nitrosopumilus sp.]